MASPSELARQAQQHSEELEQEFRLLKQLVETHDLPAIRERLIRVEEKLNQVVTLVDRLTPNKAEAEEMGALKNRLTQLEEQKKLGDTRAFQFIVLFIGGLITLAINIALLFLKK